MNYDNIKVEQKKETSEVEITGSIPLEALAPYQKKALKTISERAELPGFRKGHVPEKILRERVGEVFILEETAELALKDIAPEIIEKNAPKYVGQPQIAVTKLAPGNPVEFKIVIGVMPEIKLPDYMKIAKSQMSKKDPKEDKLEVTDEEIQKVVEEIRGQRAHHQYHLNNADKPGHEHNDAEIDALKPEFTDEFVKTVGNFESVEDFKIKAKENLLKEKETRIKDKKRSGLLEQLVAETTVAIPPVMIENELGKMFTQFETDVKNVGLKIEDYLKHINKTVEDLAKNWRPDAEKRAKLNIILEEIAAKENITADKEKVDEEVNHLTTHYKDVDPVRATMYVDHMLKIEKTINLLENQK